MVEAARQLEDGAVVFAGVGLPIMAVGVAKQVQRKGITILCESGTVDTVPTRLTLSVADPSRVRSSAILFSVNEVFSYVLQGGRVDIGLLGGAQVDRYGNVNSTVIGDYLSPRLRMPGSGGACEIASNADRTIIMMPQDTRRFVARVDFVTSPGHVVNGRPRRELGLRGNGPYAVISDLGLYRFDESSKEMYLAARHAGVEQDTISKNTAWDLKVAAEVQETAPQTPEELDYIRRLDPDRIFLGRAGQ